MNSEDYTAIIVISTVLSLEEIQKIFLAGADDFLTQPFREEDLFVRVRSMVRLKETQDILRRANHRNDEKGEV